MSGRAPLVGLVGIALTAMALGLGGGPRDQELEPDPAPSRERARAPAPEAAPVAEATSARNPFDYGAAAPAVVAPATSGTGMDRMAELPEPAPVRVVRLVGLVQKAGKVRVALMVREEMALLEVGEEAAGFRVLGVEEDVGVRLRDPEGVEFALPFEP